VISFAVHRRGQPHDGRADAARGEGERQVRGGPPDLRTAALASALADALRRRGVTDPAAGLTAEAGIAVFKIAFERWVNGTGQPDLPRLIRESLGELRVVTAGA